MKSTGIVRRIDPLGRVVLPISIRREFNLAEGDSIEIFVSDTDIILRKYEPGCTICGRVEEEYLYKSNFKFCKACCTSIATGGRELG